MATQDQHGPQQRTVAQHARAPATSVPAGVLGLQARAGNRAVVAMLAGGRHPVHRDLDPLQGLDLDGTDLDAPTEANAGATPSSGTTFVMAPDRTHRVNGSTPQQIEQAMAGLPSGGHVEVELDWSSGEANGRVVDPVVTVTMTRHLYVWGTGRDTATPADQAIIDRFFTLISEHEARHVARNRAALANAHVGLTGKTQSQADAHVMALQCAAGRSDEELDTAEGCVRFTTNHAGAELVGLATCGLPAADYTSHLTCP